VVKKKKANSETGSQKEKTSGESVELKLEALHVDFDVNGKEKLKIFIHTKLQYFPWV